MVRYHHQFNGHEFEETPGDGEEQRSLACCSRWGHKELDTTEWLNLTDGPFVVLESVCVCHLTESSP